MKLDREHVLGTFGKYISGYDPQEPKIRLKIDHTYRVAAYCDRIADSLGLAEEDKDIAWLVGMLHDIGRFEQVRRFGTFNDALSVDHAAEGVRVLYEEGWIREFVPGAEEQEYELIRHAVGEHNRLKVDETLTERVRMFCDIIRDADKLDILMVHHQTPFETIYNIPLGDLQKSMVTDAVFETFMSGRCIDKAIRKTPMDYLSSHIALIFELVFPVSRQIAAEQGYAMAMFEFGCTNVQMLPKLQIMKRKAADHLGVRLSPLELADSYFLQGYNCSQAVFGAFCDRYDIDAETALKMAGPLGAGVSGMREVCGAVSAMSMICGLEKGSAEAGADIKKKVYDTNRELLDQFADQWGSIVCREILKGKQAEPAAYASERTEEYYRKRPCLRVVESAVKLLEEQLFPDPTEGKEE